MGWAGRPATAHLGRTARDTFVGCVGPDCSTSTPPKLAFTGPQTEPQLRIKKKLFKIYQTNQVIMKLLFFLKPLNRIKPKT